MPISHTRLKGDRSLYMRLEEVFRAMAMYVILYQKVPSGKKKYHI